MSKERLYARANIEGKMSSKTLKGLKNKYSSIKRRHKEIEVKNIYYDLLEELDKDKSDILENKICFTGFYGIFEDFLKSCKNPSAELSALFESAKDNSKQVKFSSGNEKKFKLLTERKIPFDIANIYKVFQQAIDIFDDNFKTNMDFVQWYKEQFKKQGGKCAYCGIDQDELYDLFESGVLDSKKFSDGFHIERKMDKKGYTKKNCVLTCCVCNNAKSDMIDEDEFKKYFVGGIMRFYAKKLGELEKKRELTPKTKPLNELLKSLK